MTTRTLKATDAEIRYLLDETRHMFPGCGLTRDSILYTYCGVRPLPRRGLKKPCHHPPPSIRHHGRSARGLTIIGSKITPTDTWPRRWSTRWRASEGQGPAYHDCHAASGRKATREQVCRELASFARCPPPVIRTCTPYTAAGRYMWPR